LVAPGKTSFVGFARRSLTPVGLRAVAFLGGGEAAAQKELQQCTPPLRESFRTQQRGNSFSKLQTLSAQKPKSGKTLTRLNANSPSSLYFESNQHFIHYRKCFLPINF